MLVSLKLSQIVCFLCVLLLYILNIVLVAGKVFRADAAVLFLSNVISVLLDLVGYENYILQSDYRPDSFFIWLGVLWIYVLSSLLFGP